MRRRDFLGALSVLSVSCIAQAQQRTRPVVGILFDGTADGFKRLGLPAFLSGLKEAGYVEGQNVAIEPRYAEGDYLRIPNLAAELVALRVDAIYAPGNTAQAVKAATTSIPIVFTHGGDPVQLGWVASLDRPGGNMTGITFLSDALTTKQLELLHRLAPMASQIAFLTNPNNSLAVHLEDTLVAAQRLGLALKVLSASKISEIDPTMSEIAARHFGALLISNDALFGSERERLGQLATRHGIPALFNQREFAMAGGLASYGSSITDGARRAAIYVGRILKGAKPADLPVMQSEKLDFVLNLKTAKALGLEIEPSVLAIADEVIE